MVAARMKEGLSIWFQKIYLRVKIHPGNLAGSTEWHKRITIPP
jgi:hypothetical protein